MIDFACKKFDINEIVRCSFGLTKTEFNILDTMIKSNREYSSVLIAKHMKLDLTTAQRALKKFFALNLVNRRQENLENGGYIFKYRVKDKKELSSKILDIIKEWMHNVETGIHNW